MKFLFLLPLSMAYLYVVSAKAQTREQEHKVFHFAHLPTNTGELSTEFFTANRKRLRDTLPDSTMAVIFSASQKNKSMDIDFKFHQDPDFYYYTGVREPNALLLLFSSPVPINGSLTSEILFVETKDVKKEMWTGKMLGIEGAAERSGVTNVLPNEAFKTLNIPFEHIAHVYANRHQTIERDNKEHPGDLMSLVLHFESKTHQAKKIPKVNLCEDLLAALRQEKQTEELAMIQKAVDITCLAFNNAFSVMKPGMTEYQVQAVLEYTFMANGAWGPAFPTIVASGENGGIMHYTANESLLIPGDMVVMDIGAEYEGYTADITRTVPVSGTFTPEQKAVYQLVLDAQTVAIRYATAGNKFWTPHDEAYRTIGKGLIALGIIKEWGQIGDYFFHGTSHYMGLDVHDPGLYNALSPGDVITVEPGIYIPKGSPCDPKWWNIFVRIEDDLLITDGEPKVLSQCVPKSIVEIEAAMTESKP